tara:strand:- start:1739 stop:2014 length:276 start_codon:yes stop_codon:yes gene_type:complete
MSLASKIKPISYLKANAAKVIAELRSGGEPYIITQNGEAAMVVQSIAEYEQTQETLAMLKMLAQSESDIDAGDIVSVDDAFAQVKQRRGND